MSHRIEPRRHGPFRGKPARSLAVAIAFATVIAACGGDDDPSDAEASTAESATAVDDTTGPSSVDTGGAVSSAPDTASSSPDSAPSEGGGVALKIVLEQTPETIDICDEQLSPVGVLLRGNVSQPLTNLVVETGEIEPMLATEWSSPEPNVWEFKLRDDVTFHDGQPFNADAVAQWINRVIDPAAECYTLGSALNENVLGAEVVDDFTVRINLEAPDPILPRRLAFVGIGAPSANPLEKVQAPIGTGPYKFVSWSPGEDFEVARYDGYWGEPPDVSAVTYYFRAESSVRAAMAAADEVDIAALIGPQDADAPGAISYMVSETLYYRIDMTLPPFDDIRVRQAMNYAIDRQTLIDNVYNGLGEPANEIFIPSTVGYSPDVKWEYNPDKARDLLAAAAADGVPIDTPFGVYGIASQRGANGSEIQDTIAIMLQDVGLNASTEIVADYLPRLNLPTDPSYGPVILQSFHGNSLGDAHSSLTGKLSCGSAQAPICDETFDAMLVAAGQLAGDERRAALEAASKYIFDNVVPLIPVAHMSSTMIITNDAVEYTPNAATSERIVIADINIAD
jgi:peptide/nickel transport system substrate-binding protein